MEKKKGQFASLFRTFRLRSGFSTLAEFGDALAECGFIYEDSLFSHWQKGDRVPNERRLFLTLLMIFVTRGGIKNLQEANSFLESAEYGYLTDSEIQKLPKNIITKSIFQVPAEIANFTGREEYVKTIIKNLLSNKIVLVQGPAGIGKTALAIKIGHLLRYKFEDGVIWYRLDTSDIMTILSSIAHLFGEDINMIKDLEIRASIVRSILSSKKILLILDNVEIDNKIHLLLPNSESCTTILTSRHKKLYIPTSYCTVFLSNFNKQEVNTLCKKILGKSYVLNNIVKLQKIAEILGNLPLAVSIIIKQLSHNPKKIDSLLNDLRREKLKLDYLKYEDRDYYTSLSISYKNLKQKLMSFFCSLGVFAGKDFSIKAAADINNLNNKTTENYIEELIDISLVEYSFERRYRLHPLIKIFAQGKLYGGKIYRKTADYYITFLSKLGRGNRKFYPSIEVEIDNIISIFNRCYELKYWEQILKLWEFIGVFLWDMGQWDLLEKLGLKVYFAATKCNNYYAKAICCIREMSWLYYWKGNLTAAKKKALEGLIIARRLKNNYLIAYSKQRLGKIYLSTNQAKQSEEYLKASMKIFSKLKEFERLGDTLTYIGERYVLIKDFERSKEYLKKAHRLTKKINDINQNAIVMGYLGEIYYLTNNFILAKKYYQKSLYVTNIKGMNVGGKVWCNIGLAVLEKKLGNDRKANRLIRIVQENSKRLGILYDDSHPIIAEYKKLLNQG